MLAIDTYLNDIKKISQRSSRHLSNKSNKSSAPSTTTTTVSHQHKKFKDKMARNDEVEEPDFGEEDEDEILASNITQFNGKNRLFYDDPDEETDTESVKQEAPEKQESETDAVS